MAAIVTVCRDDLRLPSTESIKLYLYKNTMSFSVYGWGWTTLPIDVSDVVAFSRRNEIHINLQPISKIGWGDSLQLLAHEYGHVIENRLVRNPTRIPKWILEGFADWIAAQVVEKLRWRPYEVSVHAVKREISQYLALMPALGSLKTDVYWTAETRKPMGWIRTYGLSFVAVDRLIEQHGASALLNYFKNEDLDSSFELALDSFTRRFDTDLRRRSTERLVPFKMPKPTWTIGDHWAYQETEGDKRRQHTMRIAGRAVKFGLAGFIVAEDGRNLFYSDDSLSLVATMTNNRVTTFRTPANKILAWPLEPGMEFKSSFTLKDFETQESRYIDRVTVVRNHEVQEVPAGIFRTAKIEKYDAKTGRLQFEYWYAPDVKWFVKVRRYNGSSITEQVLLSYNAIAN